MARRYYERISAGAELQLWSDPRTFVKADLEAEVAELEVIMAYPDEIRERLAGCNGFQTLDDYDDHLDDLWNQNKDILDFFDYDAGTVNITIREGAWFLPIAVEDVSGEDVGNEAALAIDGDNGTFWQHSVDQPHQITFRLRDHNKRISKLRFRRNTNARSELTNLTVQIAKSIPGLDNPNNLALENFTPTWVDSDWTEVVLTSKQFGKYIRLTGFGSNNNNNEARIREIEAWVETREYD